MSLGTPHSVQMVAGKNISILVARLILPNRVTATVDSNNVLTYVNEPPLWVSGPVTNQMLKLVGTSTINPAYSKKGEEFRLFNDDGYTQDKVVGRSYSLSGEGHFVLNENPAIPGLDPSFDIMNENADAEEGEIYLKTMKDIGVQPAGAPATVTITAASDELTYAAAHGLTTGQALTIAATAIPGGLAALTTYYAIVVSATVIKLAATKNDALATVPVAIDITSAGTAVTTIASARKKYQVEAGNVKIMTFNEQAGADSLIKIAFTAKGQGAPIKGFEFA